MSTPVEVYVLFLNDVPLSAYYNTYEAKTVLDQLSSLSQNRPAFNWHSKKVEMCKPVDEIAQAWGLTRKEPA